MKTITVRDIAKNGMTADAADDTPGVVKLLQNFDAFTRPHTITPYLSQVSGDSSSATNRMTDFLFYNSIVYGVGTNSGTTKTTVKKKSDFTVDTWTAESNNASTTGTMVAGVFVEYQGKAYGGNSDGTIWRYTLGGGSAWVDDTAGGALANACTGNGLVHSKDDILYMAAGNIIASNNAGSWNKTALTLPSRYSVTCLCEYGNYLAIACRPLVGSGAGRSVVYLWDRDSTLNTISEVIDFGTGSLIVIEQVEGEIVGISIRSEINTTSPTPQRLVFREYAGGTADVFRELVASTATGGQLISGRKQNQRLYFLAGLTIDGTFRTGVWAVGKNAEGRWAVWFDRMANNNTAIQTSGPLNGFLMIGDYALISYFDTTYLLTQSNSASSTYTGSAIIETTSNPDMPLNDWRNQKQLATLAAYYDPIVSGGQVVMKYKVDGGSYTTVGTDTTVGSVSMERVMDASGTAFTSGKDYFFRLESTGGTPIGGFAYKYENLMSPINS